MTSRILVAAIGDSLRELDAIADKLVAISDAAGEHAVVQRLVLEALVQIETSKLILSLERFGPAL